MASFHCLIAFVHSLFIAKLVHESATLYSTSSRADNVKARADLYNSGLQVSCPRVHHDDEISPAPFCYVIEVKRSPLIDSFDEHSYFDSIQGNGNFDFTRKDMRRSLVASGGATDNLPSSPTQQTSPGRRGRSSKHVKRLEHAPVEYSLVIHPPLIIENLLPESGR